MEHQVNLTLEEQERMAFNSGNMELAVYLGRLIDTMDDLERLEEENERMSEEIEELKGAP
jgi:uncharacterized protein (UPF0335 family)